MCRYRHRTGIDRLSAAMQVTQRGRKFSWESPADRVGYSQQLWSLMKRSLSLNKAQRERRYRRRYQLEFDGLCASVRPCVHARVDNRVGVRQDRR